jgi:hypothetical protein
MSVSLAAVGMYTHRDGFPPSPTAVSWISIPRSPPPLISNEPRAPDRMIAEGQALRPA